MATTSESVFLSAAMAVCQAIPQSPLPLFVKNTFIDVEDDAFEVDPRRSSSEPPSCRHSDYARPNRFGFKRSNSDEDCAESTASGPGSPRGSISDAMSDDGAQLASVPSPTMQSKLNPYAAEWTPSFRNTDTNTTLDMSAAEQNIAMAQKPCLALPFLSLELSVLAMIPRAFQAELQELFKAAQLALSQSGLINVQVFDGTGVWGKGMKIVGTIGSTMTPNDKDEVFKSAQHALLQKAEESESVYVMGYSLRPFTPTDEGFAAMLGGMSDGGWSCWDMLAKGFCEQEHTGQCCKQHPTCMLPIYVEIAEQK